jgi:DNA-binding IclR family transcriptional regulator
MALFHDMEQSIDLAPYMFFCQRFMTEVQSLKRAFDVLRVVSLHTNGVGLSDVARATDLPKSTVSRLLATLTAIGAVERSEEAEGYRIGDEIVTLASHVAYPRNLIAIARPYLQQLSQASGETISFGIPDGDMARTIDQIDNHSELQMRSWIGKRLPLYCTSDGKLYLADWDEQALTEYLRKPLHAYTPNTITDPQILRSELAQIRSQGFAWNNQERDPDLMSVAAPVRDEAGRIVAAVCLFGPFFRFPPERQRGRYVQLTVDTANKIGARLQVLANRQNG